ncbi:MAG: hypothetical protein JRH11_03770 [Deltaproteobacteria bacterium]|nr:hypothetical protein [Deltaproteobacteria bacterium]
MVRRPLQNSRPTQVSELPQSLRVLRVLPFLRVSKILAATALLTFGLAGCNDLRDYDGAWSGKVVGDNTPDFILSGFPEGTELEIRDFAAHPAAGPPGFITTRGYDAFDDTALEIIAPLEHDLLSQYDFPGMGRVRNYIYATRPTAGPLAGRDPVVFISLIDDDSLEVRVIVGSGDETTGGHFGLWYLGRQ